MDLLNKLCLDWRKSWILSSSNIVIPPVLFIVLIRVIHKVLPDSLTNYVIRHNNLIVVCGLCFLISEILVKIFCPYLVRTFPVWENYYLTFRDTLNGRDFADKIIKSRKILGIKSAKKVGSNYSTTIGQVPTHYFDDVYIDGVKKWPDLGSTGDPKELMKIVWKSENVSFAFIRMISSLFFYIGFVLVSYVTARDLNYILCTLFHKQ